MASPSAMSFRARRLCDPDARARRLAGSRGALLRPIPGGGTERFTALMRVQLAPAARNAGRRAVGGNAATHAADHRFGAGARKSTDRRENGAAQRARLLLDMRTMARTSISPMPCWTWNSARAPNSPFTAAAAERPRFPHERIEARLAKARDSCCVIRSSRFALAARPQRESRRPRASTELTGVFLADGSRHLDTHCS